MNEVYKIESAAAFGEQFREIGIFSKRGALDYFRSQLAAPGAKNPYLAGSMNAPQRIESGREVAAWLDGLAFRSPWEMALYGTRGDYRERIALYRVTCYAVNTSWL